MDDLISRQAAIDALEFGITYAKVFNKETGEVKELFSEANEELRKAVERIKQLPPAQQWIPVSERLPFVDGEYLVTLTDKDGEWVSTAQWNTTFGGRWQDVFPDDGYRDIGNVIAWMPLPEPYKGEDHEQSCN